MTPTSNFSDSESPRPAAVETVRGLIEQVADMPVSEDADILLAELEALYTRLEADAARVAELDAANDEALERIVSLGAMNQRLEGRVIVLETALKVYARDLHYASEEHNSQVRFEDCDHKDCEAARRLLGGAS
jgi:hypothetical protein